MAFFDLLLIGARSVEAMSGGAQAVNPAITVPLFSPFCSQPVQ